MALSVDREEKFQYCNFGFSAFPLQILYGKNCLLQCVGSQLIAKIKAARVQKRRFQIYNPFQGDYKNGEDANWPLNFSISTPRPRKTFRNSLPSKDHITISTYSNICSTHKASIVIFSILSILLYGNKLMPWNIKLLCGAVFCRFNCDHGNHKAQ